MVLINKGKATYLFKQFLVGLFCLVMTGEIAASNPSLFDKMSYQEVLEVTMEGDFSALKNNRRQGEVRDVAVSFTDADGQLQTWISKTTLRGQFRRMKCTEMPPLKLNFKKGDLKAAGLAKYDDMKLVTQCMEEGKNKEWILKEYLAYKVYNELTEESFRVQLLKITFKDTGTNSTSKQWGFLIEDTAQMRKRIGATKSQIERGITSDSLQLNSFYNMTVFQYMIGNSDWDMNAGRNIKLVMKAGKYIAVPYDFDFAGIVDASYAIPNPNYSLTSTKERTYLGFAEDLVNLESTLTYFQSKQKIITNLIKKFKLLKGKHRQEAVSYLNTFFKNIDDIQYRPKKTFVASKIEAQID